MKCYIYFIINQTTKHRYVGQTTNFSRRKNEHLSEYTNLTDEEIKNIGQKYYSDWELEKFAKVKIKEQFHRIIEVVAN